MRCPSCDHENRPERRFCAECGTALAAVCASCGAANRPGEKFCGECGASLREPAALPLASPRPRHRLAAVDWLLLGTLLPVCVFGFVMSVVHGVRGDFVFPPFWVASAPDEQSYPTVFRVLSSPGAEASPLAVGDRVLRLEGDDLGGVSYAGFFLRYS